LSGCYQTLIQQRVSDGKVQVCEVFNNFVINPQDFENYRKLTLIERMISADAELN